MSRPYHSCFPLIVTCCLNHDILLEYESHWLNFLTWGMIMTTALQFSVYDTSHCYNNLNSTHTLNMIVYFCPFGLQFELLQQRHWAGHHGSRTCNHISRWVVVIARSADGGHLMLIRTYQIDQTITSNHMKYNAWGVREIDG